MEFEFLWLNFVIQTVLEVGPFVAIVLLVAFFFKPPMKYTLIAISALFAAGIVFNLAENSYTKVTISEKVQVQPRDRNSELGVEKPTIRNLNPNKETFEERLQGAREEFESNSVD